MFKPTKLTIFNINSDIIYDGEIDTPIIGLTAGDNFWWRKDGIQEGAKVIGVRYGIDLDEKRMAMEVVCEIGTIEFHSQYKDYEIKSHGIKEVDSDGGIWDINSGDIVVAVGGTINMKDKKINDFIDVLSSISLSIKTKEGIKTETMEYAKAGSTLTVAASHRRVLCSIGKVGNYNNSVAITEEIYKL